ncbi:unnamed protein product [Alopecurus aequalis]
MSFLSLPSSREVDVDRTRHGGRGKKEEVPALDMLDDFWFFSNSLGGGRDDGKGMIRKPPLLPKSPSTSSAGRTKSADTKDQLQGSKSRFHASGARRLLRTPSLPSPRIGMIEPSSKDEEEDAGGDDQAPAEVEDDDMNWSKIYEGVLRTRIDEEGRGSSSPLHRAPSTPVQSYATMGMDGHETAVTRSTPSLPRLRHSHSTLDSHCRSHTPTKPDRTPRTTGSSGSRTERGQPRRELRSFNQHPAIARAMSEFQDKKWKSSSALESIEVQGFKDLGFVFDQEELRESLADVLPGLRDSSKAKSSGSLSGSGSASDNDDANIGDAKAGSDAGDGIVRRPYLSEAWQHGARSAPPMSASASAIRLQQADARSAAEMKDQIRMWAQAVACNVRQDC